MDLLKEDNITNDFYGLTMGELEQCLQKNQVSPFHGKALFNLAYRKSNLGPWEKTRFPRNLINILQDEFNFSEIRTAEATISQYDRSVKFTLNLRDNLKINSVLMPEKKRITACLSSQIGCRFGCKFCFSGRMGWKRNLRAGEIVEQVVEMNRWIMEHPDWLKEVRLPFGQKITNVVFMGMGEPLDNVEAVIKTIKIISNPFGLALSLKKISVSTAGHLEGLRIILEQIPEVRLALSVNVLGDEKRTEVMPINGVYPLKEVFAELSRHNALFSHPVLIQYMLINGLNDSPEDAAYLLELLGGLSVKVNLIPYIPIDDSTFSSPEPSRVEAFRDILYHAGQRVMVRYSKGQDIEAGCGHLIVW